MGFLDDLRDDRLRRSGGKRLGWLEPHGGPALAIWERLDEDARSLDRADAERAAVASDPARAVVIAALQQVLRDHFLDVAARWGGKRPRGIPLRADPVWIAQLHRSMRENEVNGFPVSSQWQSVPDAAPAEHEPRVAPETVVLPPIRPQERWQDPDDVTVV